MMSFTFFLVNLLTLAAFYALLSQILNLVAGWAGMWDLGVVGLVAVGGYTFVIVTQSSDVSQNLLIAPKLPLGVGILVAGLVTACAAFIIGVPSLPLRGEYFLITTLAFAEIVRQIAINATNLTLGTVGFSNFDRPLSGQLSGRPYRLFMLGFVLLLVGLTYLFMRRLTNSPYGRLLRASRDNEAVALSLGKNVTRLRLTTFTFSGLLIGLSAPVYMWHISTIVPSLFRPQLTFTVWTALVIGGIGSRSGPVLGAAILIVGTEFLTFFQGSASAAELLAATRPLLLGLLLVLFVRYRSLGIVPEARSFQNESAKMLRDEVIR